MSAARSCSHTISGGTVLAPFKCSNRHKRCIISTLEFKHQALAYQSAEATETEYIITLDTNQFKLPGRLQQPNGKSSFPTRRTNVFSLTQQRPTKPISLSRKLKSSASSGILRSRSRSSQPTPMQQAKAS